MNKVVSIEIARQVFWVEEGAYELLQAYLKKIRQQLANDECAEEIYQDIELRVAELLFAFSGDKNKAIFMAQLEKVIAQVGYIDDEDMESAMPRRSYRDPHGKLLGGVCAGLALWLGIPVLVVRIVFLALATFFGVGVVLYLIFWISLEAKTTRNAALAAQGKAQTARRIAHVEVQGDERAPTFQRWLFLPVTIMGVLCTVLMNHVKGRQGFYLPLFKQLAALFVLAMAAVVCGGLLEFSQKPFFSWPIAWLSYLSVLYLVVLVLAVFFGEYYRAGSSAKVHKTLKWGAVFPVVVIVVISIYLNLVHAASQSEDVEKFFSLTDHHLHLQINDGLPDEGYAAPIRIQIRASASMSSRVKLRIQYSAYGSDEKRAEEHIRSIDYFYTFEGDRLTLDRYWSLVDGAYLRGQDVLVLVEIPQDITVTSSLPLEVDPLERPLRYGVSDSGGGVVRYLVRGSFLHESGDGFRSKLSSNERALLEAAFCEAFFIGEPWRCASNLSNPVSENRRFSIAHQNRADAVERLRQYLFPHRELAVSRLNEMHELLVGMKGEQRALIRFQEYLEHLLSVKLQPEPENEVKSE